MHLHRSDERHLLARELAQQAILQTERVLGGSRLMHEGYINLYEMD
jgi:hypothetical protein